MTATSGQRQDFERALACFNRVLLGAWDARFAEIEVTACIELNAMLHSDWGTLPPSISLSPSFYVYVPVFFLNAILVGIISAVLYPPVLEKSAEDTTYSGPLGLR